MSMCVYSVYMLSCVKVAALRRYDPPSKGPPDWVKDQQTEKSAKAQQRAVEPIYTVNRWPRHSSAG
jgi:hypothetical protein